MVSRKVINRCNAGSSAILRKGYRLIRRTFRHIAKLSRNCGMRFSMVRGFPYPGSDCPGCPTLLAGRHPFQYRIRHMVPRYSRPDMVATWEPESKFRIWFEIEAHATDALAELGVVPRSEERRVGNAGVSTCRSRWSPYH